MHIFRSCKTLICPSTSMLQEAGHRILSDPMELSLLLNRLAFSNSHSSRLENRVRIGSTVVLKSLSTAEHLTLRIVKDEKARPAIGSVSFTSIIGAALLGLGCGDVAQVETSAGEPEWEVISVDHSSVMMNS